MRQLVVGLVLVGLAACSDSSLGPKAPNTDVGLVVWASASPAMMSVRDTMKVLHLRVYVRNPSSQEIRVSGGPPYVFTTDPADSRGLWGSLRIARDGNALNAGPNVSWWGDSVYVVGPNETTGSECNVTLRQWRRAGWPMTPGVYRVRGWFSNREGAGARLVLTP